MQRTYFTIAIVLSVLIIGVAQYSTGRTDELAPMAIATAFFIVLGVAYHLVVFRMYDWIDNRTD